MHLFVAGSVSVAGGGRRAPFGERKARRSRQRSTMLHRELIWRQLHSATSLPRSGGSRKVRKGPPSVCPHEAARCVPPHRAVRVATLAQSGSLAGRRALLSRPAASLCVGSVHFATFGDSTFPPISATLY